MKKNNNLKDFERYLKFKETKNFGLRVKLLKKPEVKKLKTIRAKDRKMFELAKKGGYL